jgi:triosephosphate isomerase
MAKRILVANWKMQLSFNQSCAFVQNNLESLKQMAHDKTIILCPSFPALDRLAKLCDQSSIAIGAQTVSRHPFGPYTGEVSATSLAQVGCTYCIIGHSESRQYNHESNINIEHKLKELIKNNITPIICIGESQEHYEQQKTYLILEEQLFGNLEIIKQHEESVSSFIIAYEPIWAIGSNSTPPDKVLTDIFKWLHQECSKRTKVPCSLIYGGSVNQDNAKELLSIQHVSGLLIGRASTEIESFKAIINLT